MEGGSTRNSAKPPVTDIKSHAMAGSLDVSSLQDNENFDVDSEFNDDPFEDDDDDVSFGSFERWW